MQHDIPPSGKLRKGFACMSPEKRKAIASKGGKSVPPEHRSFSMNPKLAEDAGRRGGVNVPPQKRAFSVDRELAAKAGAKGGGASRTKQDMEGDEFFTKKGDEFIMVQREILPGQRFTTLTQYAEQLRGKGKTNFEINLVLELVNKQCCKPPLAEDEIHAIAFRPCKP